MEQKMNDIDKYGEFTESIWLSKHQLDCSIFTGANMIANGATGENRCDCDQDSERSLMIMTMGLAGEVGEVMEILKKRVRDGKFNRVDFIKELGDVAYYWARLCKQFDILPSYVLQTNMNKLIDRKNRGMMRGNGDNR